jgi:hypothetical protein
MVPFIIFNLFNISWTITLFLSFLFIFSWYIIKIKLHSTFFLHSLCSCLWLFCFVIELKSRVAHHILHPSFHVFWKVFCHGSFCVHDICNHELLKDNISYLFVKNITRSSRNIVVKQGHSFDRVFGSQKFVIFDERKNLFSLSFVEFHSSFVLEV